MVGHTDAPEINTVTDWLSQLLRRDHLPQKVVLLHQFKASMIVAPQAVVAHPELALVQHLDGFGSRAAKLAIYASLCRLTQFHLGFKPLYRQDMAMLPPAGGAVDLAEAGLRQLSVAARPQARRREDCPIYTR